MKKESVFNGYNSVFATRLRKIMDEQDKTQKEIADVLGITRQAISQYLDGAVQPNLEKLYKLSTYLHVSADWLIGLSEARTPNTTIRAVHDLTGLTELSIVKLAHEHLNNNDRKIPVIDALIEHSDTWEEITEAIILFDKYRTTNNQIKIDDMILDSSTLMEAYIRKAENALRNMIDIIDWEVKFKSSEKKGE